MRNFNKILVLVVLIFGGIILPFLPSGAFERTPEDKFKKISKPNKVFLAVNGQIEEISKETLNGWFKNNPVLYRERGSVSEIFNINFCPHANHFCDFFLPIKETHAVSIKNAETIQEEEVKLFLRDLARRTDRDPIEAKFQIEDGRVTVFSLSENGSQLEIEESFKEIKNKLEDFNNSADSNQTLKINLVSKQIKPEIGSSEIDNLGISELIGEGRSNFRGSPKNRIYNIKMAAKRFHGILIKPNQEFSFAEALGEVDEEHGYLPELVIKHNKTEPEFGGGICQVSTTAFRAAVYSGLKITARKNHAYPVVYYNPQGMDATIYIPRPDLRFINNTPGHILIQIKIEKTELIFQFYGTADGRKVEIEGPKILEKNPDGSMKTTFTQRVMDKDENEILKDVFISVYDSPSKYLHSGQEEKLKEKPKKWSDREWEEYKKTHGI